MSETVEAIVARLQQADRQLEATIHTANTALTFADAARENITIVFRAMEGDTINQVSTGADEAIRALHDTIRAASQTRTAILMIMSRLLG